MEFSEYLLLLKKHEEQKALEEYQKTRILPRPKTTKAHIALYIALFLCAVSGMCVGFYFVRLPTPVQVVLFLICILVFCELYFRFLGVKAVECYQHYASEDRRRRCLCIPSCSEYAILCFKKYFFIKAILKIRKRLFKTCRGDEYKRDDP